MVGLCFLSDALDGYFARKLKQNTRLGAFLDPLGDKLLIDSAFLLLVNKPQFALNLSLPIWVVAVIITRDIIFALASLFLHLRRGIKISPSFLGKIATVCQMIAILSALFFFTFTRLIWITAGILTIIAGIGYIYREFSVSEQR